MTITQESATTQPRLPGWPGFTEPCPSWCDGYHSPKDMPGDRAHHSESVYVTVLSMDPVDMGDNQPPVADSLQVSLRHHVDERTPSVNLMVPAHVRVSDGRGGHRHEYVEIDVWLRPSEALELGTRLVEHSDLAV